MATRPRRNAPTQTLNLFGRVELHTRTLNQMKSVYETTRILETRILEGLTKAADTKSGKQKGWREDPPHVKGENDVEWKREARPRLNTGRKT